MEYAHIKTPDHVLVLSNGKQLPHSTKGSVIRQRAGVSGAARLDDRLKRALGMSIDARDCDTVTRQAIDVGFESVDAFLAAHGGAVLAEIGVDSLEVVSGMNRGQREADPDGNNLKAWTEWRSL